MKEISKDLLPALAQKLEIHFHDGITYEELKQKLASYINDFIVHDFEKLVQLLYRVDVSEQKLKQLLKENSGEDAGVIIAQLIIEREEQKLKSRQSYKQQDDIAENEKW